MASTTFTAFGTLLGIAAAHPLRRFLPVRLRAVEVAGAGLLGAVIIGPGVELALGVSRGESLSLASVLLVSLLTALVAALLLGKAGALDDEAPDLMVSVGVVLAAFAFVPLANLPSAHQYAPWYALAMTYWLAVGGGVLLALFLLVKLFPLITRGWANLAERAMRIPAGVFVGSAAIAGVVLAAVLFTICFGRQPQDVDEAAQLWHAKILLSGRLTLPVDPNVEFFMMDDMVSHGRWFSQYPIGGPAFAALGVAAHAAWLLNPVLIGLTIVGVHAFARRAYGEATARAATVLFALAPFALFMGASYMNCIPVLWLASVAMAQAAIWMYADTGRRLDMSAALIGLAVGAAVTVRPLDGIVLAAVVGALQLTCAGRDLRKWKSFGWQVGAGLVPIALLCYANYRTTGSPFRLGYELLYGDATRLGFHLDPYGLPHTPARALAYASKYLLQLSLMLFEWPVPALGVLIAGLLVLRRPTRWDYFLVALLGAQTLAYALYWFNGAFRGPRYLVTALPAVVILVARAPFLLSATTRGTVKRMVPLVLPACVLLTWLAFPIKASVAGRVRQYQRETSAGARVDPARVAQEAGIHHALVFVNEDSRNRALRQLWALGILQGDALQLLASGPVCAARLAIEAEYALGPGHETGRLQRMEHEITSYRPASPLPEPCLEDVRRDAAGTAPYRQFLSANSIDAHGNVAGDVIYVLDLGARNNLLRQRFGDRTWYRFGARTTASADQPALVPYDAAEREVSSGEAAQPMLSQRP